MDAEVCCILMSIPVFTSHIGRLYMVSQASLTVEVIGQGHKGQY